MPVYPRIAGPCPYSGPIADILDGDMCRLCHRQVHDLTAMDDETRLGFLARCGGAETCVTYAAPKRLAAALLMASTVALPMAAAAAPDPGSVEEEEVIIVVAGRVAPFPTANLVSRARPVEVIEAMPIETIKPQKRPKAEQPDKPRRPKASPKPAS